MFRRMTVFFAVALVLTVTGTVLAQTPVSPGSSDPTWRAYYWNNTTLSGSPVLERAETALNFDWGLGSPHPSVNADHFSARWTRTIHVTEDVYRFSTTSDDGIRVWLDNELIIDEWYDHAATTFTADRRLSTGHHWVVVEYYENKGSAVASLNWDSLAPSHQEWLGEYWNNTSLSGAPDLTRSDETIDFDWAGLSPDPNVIHVDSFSARWTRSVNLPAGRYRFLMTTDDGGRLWVNNRLLIDAWREQPATTVTEEMWVPGGNLPIKMEYYERGGQAVAKLSWEIVDTSIREWRGEYYDNKSFAGTPPLVRNDPQINFDWGAGSPAPGTIGIEHFSVRWTRTVNLDPGRYRFVITTDDGARLWVNDHLIIDAWRDQAAATYTADVDLAGRTVPIKMEYYENSGLAVAKLSWSLTTATTPSWQGEYYNNNTLSGSPSLVRNDAHIDFYWGSGSPSPGTISADGFSVRWTRALHLSGGSYRFSVTTDDGVRLWVNGQLVIDAWRDQAATTITQDISLPGGAIPVRMEYYENAGQAVARLSWSLIGKIETPATIIVDDSDPEFVSGGSSTGWRHANEGYNGRLTWTRNNDWQRPNYNWARWYPKLTPGRYEVYVFVPERYSTTSHAKYWISHADGYTSRVVNQSASGGQWTSLGTYRFRGTTQDYVSLNDTTGEPRLSRLIAFDAVKWIAR